MRPPADPAPRCGRPTALEELAVDSSREEDLGVYQMLWDCSYCGASKLLARDHKHCPNCGGAQDPTWRYFPEDADKVKVEDHVYIGKDVICAACQAPNAAGAAFCGACGAELDGSKAVQLRGDQAADEGAAFAADTARAARDEHRAAKLAAQAARQAEADAAHGAPPPAPEESGGSKGKIAGIGCGVLLLLAVVCGGLGFWWFGRTTVATIEATSRSWTTTIQVEEKQSVRESAWKESVPSGAERVSCRSEKRDSRSVSDGETCKNVRKDQGDGTFKEVKECKPKTKQEAVMGEKCDYTVNKWARTREAKATGGPKDAVAYPDPKLRRTGDCVGCERAGAKAEVFTIQWRESGGKRALSCDTTRSIWDKVQVGSKWKGPVGVNKDFVDCAKLQPAG